MILSILLTLKIILFTSLTQVKFNRISIIVLSSLISMLILGLIYKYKSKRRNIWALVFYTLTSTIMLIDAAYYSHFNVLPMITAAKQANQLLAVGDTLKLILTFKILLLVLDIPLVIYFLRKIESRAIRIKPILLMIILTSGFIITRGQLPSVMAQELYTYHLVDIGNTILGRREIIEGHEITKAEIEELKSRARLKEGKLTGIGKDKNLIVLQVESLQDFVINFSYKGQEITPNLNKLIEDRGSLYYDDYHQLIGRGNTSDAEFVTHNSLYPSMDEPTYTEFENNIYYGLPWLLRDNGYTAWAFHGYEKTFWNREEAYKSQGFQRFISEEDFEFEDPIGFGIRDEDFYDQSIEYIKELDSVDDNPFYAFLISLTSHRPYKMPEEYNVLNIEEPYKDTVVGDYLQSVHYADKEIGRFIDNLKDIGLYDDTVIAIYGDHFGISSAQEDEQILTTELLGMEYDFDHMMNIPLIIHVPGEDINERVSTIGSQLDFYPTITNILGVDNTKGLIFGRDLNNYEGYKYVSPQTYMLKGSFLDENTLFEISRDGIFEHSRAIDRTTRKELDVEKQKEMSERVQEEIHKSNYILETDYLKELLDKP